MNTYYRIGALAILLVTACSSPSLSSPVPETRIVMTETATVVPSPHAAATPEPTAPVIPTGAPTPTPALVPVQASVESRCPADPEVSLAELGLGPTSRLIAKPAGTDDETRTFFNVIGSDETSILRGADGKPFFFDGTSPDQKWAMLAVWSEDGENFDLWISSIDGREQWLALKNLARGDSPLWVGKQTIIIVDRKGRWPITFMRLNPFSLETEPLLQILLDQGAYAFSPDATQVIHLEVFSWKLYNYLTDTSQTIFPWVDSQRIQLPFFMSVNWTASGVSLALMNETSLDLAVNLRPDSLADQNVTVYRIMFSDESTWWRVFWWSSDNRLVAFTRVLGEQFGDTVGPTQFYILDTTGWVLYDYCLPRELVPSWFWASADERFVAWSGLREGENLFGTIVMELTTGRRAWMPGWEVLSWGKVAEQ